MTNKAVFLDSTEETISSPQTYSFEQGDAETSQVSSAADREAELRCVMLVIKCV